MLLQKIPSLQVESGTIVRPDHSSSVIGRFSADTDETFPVAFYHNRTCAALAHHAVWVVGNVREDITQQVGGKTRYLAEQASELLILHESLHVPRAVVRDSLEQRLVGPLAGEDLGHCGHKPDAVAAFHVAGKQPLGIVAERWKVVLIADGE